MVLLCLLPGAERPLLIFGIACSVFATVLLGAWLALFITGQVLFHCQTFHQDEQAFYQGRRRLDKSNLHNIDPRKMLWIYYLSFTPKKNGVWKSCALGFYFHDVLSMAVFIVENQIVPYLDAPTKLWLWGTLHLPELDSKIQIQLAAQLQPCPC